VEHYDRADDLLWSLRLQKALGQHPRRGATFEGVYRKKQARGFFSLRRGPSPRPGEPRIHLVTELNGIAVVSAIPIRLSIARPSGTFMGMSIPTFVPELTRQATPSAGKILRVMTKPRCNLCASAYCGMRHSRVAIWF
jgi:hypothetical protein